MEARQWAGSAEYVDSGISGTKDRRPALDRLITDARRRKVDAVIVWRLDRFGRSLRHLITAIDELNAAGVRFVSLGENIDTGSATGRLLLGIMGSFAEFERERIRERVLARLQRGQSTRETSRTPQSPSTKRRHSWRHRASSGESVGCLEIHSRPMDSPHG